MRYTRLGWLFFIISQFVISQEVSANNLPKLAPFTTLYDYQIVDSRTLEVLSLASLAKRLADKEVIFFGEFHGNHAVHLFQAQLQAKLFQQRPHQVLSMEQFNRDQQDILNRYLDSEIGEKTLIKEAPAWGNYAASYRPLVEFAKQHFIPVIAANAPADTVRCVGRQGKTYLKKLPTRDAQYLPKDPFYSDPTYAAQFQQFMQQGKASHNGQSQPSNSYFAQLLRDNSMAESVHLAHSQYTNSQIIHLNGAFHSNSGLGTVAALKHLNPKLTLSVISPISQTVFDQPSLQSDDLKLGDYLLIVPAQPTDYVQATKRRAAMKAMFEQAKLKTCH
ncbi:hypothetical protein CYQ88_04605 [Hydrogenovibrio sp. SC-1]|uniref:ChaN family lipoprotein n=1 Tax=Hydrogenovibrio sp. SC-1 TaxID=2065820 RepID=UPI000C7E07FF|nr:ChaN family lipoprotein [Hydrogenovibrio sp. SC-1]PLA74597.1 hypothetical protein CYQ88_04605 [Hydrogenovibrio sp. SC-1]